MKAIILAAGIGSRLRPVTLTTPKPLVPVANRPLIAYALEMIREAGMDEVGIVVNSMESAVVKRIGDGEKLGVKVTYIVQEQQLGLAHAVSLCQDFIADDTAFAMFLGDNIFQDKMEKLLREFESSNWEAAIALGEVPDPERFGVGVIGEDGSITELLEKPNPAPSNWAVAGVYLFRTLSIFDAISKIKPSARGELEITDAIDRVIKSGKPVQAYKLDGWWIDAGKPKPIIEANQLVMSEMPYAPAPINDGIDENSDVSPRVILGENVEIVGSVVRGPAIIGDNVKIINSYVGPYTSLGDDVHIENSEIEASIVMRGSRILNIPGRIDSSLLADNAVVEAAGGNVPRAQRFVLAENSVVQVG
ncbi:MAG: glucose-1-phosphate thymidylyltransferase [Chloroflexota bacterium]